MITAGIVTDNYKVDKFKEELDSAGFKYTIHTGITQDTTLVKVEIESPKVAPQIGKICDIVNEHFSKSKLN